MQNSRGLCVKKLGQKYRVYLGMCALEVEIPDASMASFSKILDLSVIALATPIDSMDMIYLKMKMAFMI